MSKPRNRVMRPNPRTRPTTGNAGPREPGPHGKTLELREGKQWARSLFKLDRSLPVFMQLPKHPDLQANPVDDQTHQSVPRRGGKGGAR